MRGRLDEATIDSALLAGNTLGDPATRPIWVYTPPAYGRGHRRYPTVYWLQGWSAQLDMWKARRPLRTTFLEDADELFASGGAPPCVLVFVDCWTSLGGSQFLDSPATGRYRSYLCDEVVPWVDARYRTLAAREHRGLAGKSSGGYGAMTVAMARPDLFGGFASHAGDALFEHCYLPSFSRSVRALRDEYGGSFARFFDDFRARPAFSKPSDALLLDDWSMAACYSPTDEGGVRLPYDTETGELDPETWARWLGHDPVRVARRAGEALRSMRAVYLDAGRHDQFALDLGAAAFHREAVAAGVSNAFFELFDGTHDAIEYRYPRSTAFLAARLS